MDTKRQEEILNIYKNANITNMNFTTRTLSFPAKLLNITDSIYNKNDVYIKKEILYVSILQNFYNTFKNLNNEKYDELLKDFNLLANSKINFNYTKYRTLKIPIEVEQKYDSVIKEIKKMNKIKNNYTLTSPILYTLAFYIFLKKYNNI